MSHSQICRLSLADRSSPATLIRALIVLWICLFIASLCCGCASPVFGQQPQSRSRTDIRPNGVVMQWCNPFCPGARPMPARPTQVQPTTPKAAVTQNQPPATTLPQQPFNREDLPRLVTNEIERLRPILTSQIRQQLAEELGEQLPGFRREFEHVAKETVSRAGPEIQSRTLESLAPRLVKLEGSVGDVAQTHPELLAKVAGLTKTVVGLSTSMGGLTGDVALATTWAKYGAIGGPAGMAAAVAAGFLFRRVTKRAGGRQPPDGPGADASGSPTLRIYQPVVMESPPLPQAIVTENVHVPVEVNRFDWAMKEAIRLTLREYPGAQPTLTYLENLSKQILSGAMPTKGTT